MNRLGQDFRHALRSLLRTPSFTAVAVLTLGLGIGANTAIFQLIDAVALRKLPVRDPDGLAAVRISGGNRGFGVNPGRYPELTSPVWEDLQKHQQAFSEMFAWKTRDLRVGERNDLKRAYGIAVSGDFFNVLGIRPFRGRLLGPSDAGACPETAAVVSHAYWQREMGGRDIGNGTTIRINLATDRRRRRHASGVLRPRRRRAVRHRHPALPAAAVVPRSVRRRGRRTPASRLDAGTRLGPSRCAERRNLRRERPERLRRQLDRTIQGVPACRVSHRIWRERASKPLRAIAPGADRDHGAHPPDGLREPCEPDARACERPRSRGGRARRAGCVAEGADSPVPHRKRAAGHRRRAGGRRAGEVLQPHDPVGHVHAGGPAGADGAARLAHAAVRRGSWSRDVHLLRRGPRAARHPRRCGGRDEERRPRRRQPGTNG